MKRVLLYSGSLVSDTKWARQFVAADTQTRVSIDTGGSPDWVHMAGFVKKAAAQAGTGGVIFFLSGHGVAADDTDPGSAWVSLGNGGKVKIVPDLVFYDFDPDGPGPKKSRKSYDDQAIKDAEALKTAAGTAAYLEERLLTTQPKAKQQAAIRQTLELAEESRARQQKYNLYKQMGADLSSNKVERVVFLACNIGNETKMIDKISKDWGVEVVAYKQFITLQEVDGQVRLFLSPTREGTGASREKHDTKFIPDITANTAHMAHP
jgi:hypothetical protein